MTVIVLLINYPTAQLQCFIGMMIPMIHCFHRTCLGPKSLVIVFKILSFSWSNFVFPIRLPLTNTTIKQFSLVYHWTVHNVPTMCHMPHAAFFMNIPQKPLKGTTLKSIPKLPIWILSQILKTFSQSEANSFGWSMASNNWKACASNILKHRKKTFRPSVNWHFCFQNIF